MRGTIENLHGDRGTIVVGTERYDFDSSLWRSSAPPVVGMAVELAMVEGKVASVLPVPVSNPAQVPVNQFADSVKRVARSIFDSAGKSIVIGYGIFAIAALFLPFFSADTALGGGLSLTLPDAPALLTHGMGGGTVLWVLLAIVTIAVPYVWKDRYAPLAFVGPALVTLHGAYQLYRLRSAMGELAEMVPVSFGFGAYLCFGAAGYLAFCGVTRFMRQRRTA